ncbi:MAG: aminopeptidase [Defluviitaleaceae bacterium]|nr:aminopeptidase [Defluviitaleaceae bacterium]
MNQQFENYATLFVRVGGNVQKGQLVVISSDISVADYAHMVEVAAYDAGASEVIINWHDDISARTRYLKGADEIFNHYPEWRISQYKEWDDQGAVYLTILSYDPDYLTGVKDDRLSRQYRVTAEKLKAHKANTGSYKNRWSLCAFPSKQWAIKVFPTYPAAEAMKKLAEQILIASRADSHPLQAWKIHCDNFVARQNYLNQAQFKTLHFTNNIGTNVKIGLPQNHYWIGGVCHDQQGIPFCPNIPTEEIFTAPNRNDVNGKIIATKPFSYIGHTIEGLELTFKDGVITHFKATRNEHIFNKLITLDEGSNRLGEVALVPKSSPINHLGTVFHNIMFDENTTCHLALGRAYATNLQGGVNMTREELLHQGLNDSAIAENFVFGTDDMNVAGITQQGKEIWLIQNGEYSI